LLGLSRAEILAFLRSAGQAYRKDSTNDDIEFHRNWIRRRVVPLLESRAPGFQSRLASLAEIARDEESYWDDVLRRIEGRLLRRKAGGWLLDMRGLLRYSAAVQRRFLRRIAGQDLLTFTGLENLRRWMQSPPTNGRLWQLRKGWVVQRLSRSGGSPSSTIFWFGRPNTSKG
jgi:tRNA(Ile)-lysidine synthase